MRKNIIPSFFGTLSETVDAVQLHIDDYRLELVFGTVNTPAEDHWTQQLSQKGPVAYGQAIRADFEILTRKGKSTRAWFHINIYRSENGTYELNCYVL
jgi:hypothetical protein